MLAGHWRNVGGRRLGTTDLAQAGLAVPSGAEERSLHAFPLSTDAWSPGPYTWEEFGALPQHQGGQTDYHRDPTEIVQDCFYVYPTVSDQKTTLSNLVIQPE